MSVVASPCVWASCLLLGLVASTACACVPEHRPDDTAGGGSHSAGSVLASPPRGGDRAESAELAAPFRDDFERREPGSDWNVTGSGWELRDGRLCVSGAHNHPAWLRRRLPTNARIEFDATSASTDGDLKAEVWGDGQSAASAAAYRNATSYIVIFGGWKNTRHVLARLDEHAPERRELQVATTFADPRLRPVQPDRKYRFKIERSDGQTVRYFVDETEILNFTDEQPLTGIGHDHFAFNDWQVPACFDNLVVTPLKS